MNQDERATAFVYDPSRNKEFRDDYARRFEYYRALR